MHRGHDGHAEIVILAADADAHAPVLRQAALGDVQAAHDFEARSERELHGFGRRSGVGQHAVDAVTKAQLSFERLDVDVARAVFDGLDENQVGQLDDGSFLAGSGELVEVDFLDGFLRELDVVIRNLVFLLVALLDDVLHRSALGGIEVVELVDDRFIGSDQRSDFKAGDAADVVDGEHVERIGHRDEQLVFEA